MTYLAAGWFPVARKVPRVFAHADFLQRRACAEPKANFQRGHGRKLKEETMTQKIQFEDEIAQIPHGDKIIRVATYSVTDAHGCTHDYVSIRTGKMLSGKFAASDDGLVIRPREVPQLREALSIAGSAMRNAARSRPARESAPLTQSLATKLNAAMPQSESR